MVIQPPFTRGPPKSHPSYDHLFILFHELIPLNHLRKVLNLGGMTVRLELNLLPHSRRKAAAPPMPRIRPINTLNSIPMHQLRKPAAIVDQSHRLDEEPELGDAASLAHVLMADNGLGHGLGLRLRRPVLREQVERLVAALELEAQVRAVHVVLGGADVVEEAGQEPGFRAAPEGGEVLVQDCLAWARVSMARFATFAEKRGGVVTVVEDAHAVVEGLFWQVLFCVLGDCLH